MTADKRKNQYQTQRTQEYDSLIVDRNSRIIKTKMVQKAHVEASNSQDKARHQARTSTHLLPCGVSEDAQAPTDGGNLFWDV